jgi:hypothetical protein
MPTLVCGMPLMWTIWPWEDYRQPWQLLAANLPVWPSSHWPWGKQYFIGTVYEWRYDPSVRRWSLNSSYRLDRDLELLGQGHIIFNDCHCSKQVYIELRPQFRYQYLHFIHNYEIKVPLMTGLCKATRNTALRANPLDRIADMLTRQ